MSLAVTISPKANGRVYLYKEYHTRSDQKVNGSRCGIVTQTRPM
jgi:hypothetical protein